MYVAEILDDVQEYVGQADQTTVFSRLTDAIEVLANKCEGIWDPLVGIMDICTTTDGNYITLPREVDTPLALNVDGQPRMFRNKWFEFHINGPGSRGAGRDGFGWNWDDRGDVVTIMDILQPSYLVAIAALQNDLGANLRIYGFDGSGNWIRTQDANGNWNDGYLIPLQLTTDFPQGIPYPSGTRLFVRNFGPTATMYLISSTPHGLATGAPVVLSLQSGTIPAPLINGTTYYAAVIDPYTVQLFPTQSGALTGVGGINLTTFSATAVLNLADQRVVATQTKFNCSSPLNMTTGQTITFTATTLPVPLVSGTTYYANVLDANDFTAHANAIDAAAGNNPIDVSTPGSNDLKVQASQVINPNTVLNFSTNHDFLQGDLVFASNTGGTLPNPLLPQTSYYIGYISPKQIQLYNDLADATAGTNAIVLTTAGSGTNALFKTLPASMAVGNPAIIVCAGHNMGAGDLFSVTTAGSLPTTSPALALATNYQVGNPITATSFEPQVVGVPSVSVSSYSRSSNVATLVTATAHGYVVGTYIDVVGMSDSSFDATRVQVTVLTNSTTFSYASVGTNENTTSEPTGTTNQDPGLNCTAGGTGQLFVVISRAFTIGFLNQWQTNTTEIVNGTPIQLTATGALPSTSPVMSLSTTYYARVLTSATLGELEFFETASKATTLTQIGTASVAKTGGVATIVTAVNHGFSTGDYIDITGFTTNSQFNATHVQITVTNATTFTYAISTGTVNTTADTTGLCAFSPIQVYSLGSGTLNLILNRAITVLLRSNFLTVSSDQYLASPYALVQFGTSGTLPAPLALNTTYQVTVVNGLLQVADSSGNIITFTNIGNGTQEIQISDTFMADIPTTYDVPANEYNNGDAVIVESQPISSPAYVPPSPLVLGATYYVRRINNGQIELYDTLADAQNVGSTTGRQVAMASGVGSGQLAQTLPGFQMQRITRILKDQTSGFITLYALDPGRNNNLTQIGWYYPDELEPRYRRVRIDRGAGIPNANGTCQPWVRMRYKKKTYAIQSTTDYIPLNSKMAILCMVRALELLRDNFIDQYQQFSSTAEALLTEAQLARSGPEAPSIQIDTWVTTNVYRQGMT